ncbi:MAG: alpha-amylase family protein [Propionibacteriaceae bacterium]|jgi:glycosidase|nr:alpha-amylase family protein [Propionibacteriaceae bacterium]
MQQPTPWIERTIWWQVYPLGFTAAFPPRPQPGRGLGHLIAWLDYARELGVNGLALGPIFAASSHGYDTLDHFQIDPRLGDQSDFDALVSACQQRGLRLMLDGVFNHVSRQHPWFQRALREGPEGRYAGFFALDWPNGQPRPRVFEGHGDLVALNHANPEVALYVQQVMDHWLNRGADAWRLDAAYAVPDAFWRSVLPELRQDHRDAWFVGEVIHGDYARRVEAGGLDSVTQYELWKSTWSALASRNFFELDWTLKRHNGFLDHFLPLTFIGNHDVTRLATAAGGDKAVLALAVLMTVGGVPSIYYGDERGFEARKENRPGGDDAVRPAFPATVAQLGAWGEPVYRAHQDLIGLRRRHPWLIRARSQPIDLTMTRYVYVVRGDGGELVVDLELEPSPQVEIRDSVGRSLYRWPRA